MYHRHSKPSRRRIASAFLCALATAASGSSAEPPKPTPRPGTLGAYAEGLTLDRSSIGDPSAPLVLTNQTVVSVGSGGRLVVGGTSADGPGWSSKQTPPGEVRARWRAAYRRQQQVIAALERRRAAAEIELDHIGSLRLTVRTLARLQRAEAKIRDLDRQIADEQRELARVVREARSHGAEPGWFR